MTRLLSIVSPGCRPDLRRLDDRRCADRGRLVRHPRPGRGEPRRALHRGVAADRAAVAAARGRPRAGAALWVLGNRLRPGPAAEQLPRVPGQAARARVAGGELADGARRGRSGDFGLPDIFQLIGLQRKTGLLTLINDKDKETVTVTFENGMVVMADSSQSAARGPARQRARQAGQAQPRAARGRARDPEADAAAARPHPRGLERDHTRDLRDALTVQVAQIVFRVFRWRDGRYQFAASDAVDYDRENFDPMSADFILMEGIRMVDEWPIIEKKIPSFDMVFRPVVDPAQIEVGAAGARGAAARGARDRDLDRQDPARRRRGARLPPRRRRAHGAGDHRRDGRRGVRGLPHALRLPEPQPDRARRPGQRRAGRGRRRTRSRARRCPGYAVVLLVSALALAGLLVHQRRAVRGDRARRRAARQLRRAARGRAALAADAARARARGLARDATAARPRHSTSWCRPGWCRPRTSSTPGRARSATRPTPRATC